MFFCIAGDDFGVGLGYDLVADEFLLGLNVASAYLGRESVEWNANEGVFDGSHCCPVCGKLGTGQLSTRCMLVESLTLALVKEASLRRAPYPFSPRPMHWFDSQVDMAAAPGLLLAVSAAVSHHAMKTSDMPSFNAIDTNAR